MTKPLRDAAAEIVRRLREFNEHPDPGALDRFEGVASEHAPALADWATRARKVIGRIASETPHYGGHAMDCSDCKLWALIREFDGEGRRDG